MALPARGIEMEADKFSLLERLLEHVPSEERQALRSLILRETRNLNNVSATSLHALWKSLERDLIAYRYLSDHDR